jgi:D-alanyl-D-alanine carboxypeptidase
MPSVRTILLFAFVLCAGCARTDAREADPPRVNLAGAPAMPLVAVAGPAEVVGAVPCRAVPAGVEDLSAILEPLRQKHNLPALGAIVVTPDGTKALGVTGVRRYGDPTPACVDDAFMLASNTKAMSAVVLAKLVEQGRLAWTTTIGEVFADIASRNHAYDNVTLEHLLSHRGGFSREPTTVSLGQLRSLGGSLHEQREQYARIVLGEPPANTPGTAYLYSNTGFTIAGLMGERRTGQSWEDLLNLVVFQPLGMAHAGFGPMATLGRVDGLWAHHMRGSPVPIPPDGNSINPLFRTPAGNVHLPLASWGRFISEELRSFEGRGALVANATYEHLHTAPFGGKYAFGWQVVQKSWTGGTAYAHSGTDTRNFSVAWLLPKQRVGIVVATNVGTKAASQGISEVMGALRARIPGISDPADPQEVIEPTDPE